MEGGNENCLDELSYRLCFPLPKPDLPDGIESFLSSFPWKIQWDDENVENPETGIARRVLPSYLDLRRKQNIAFADEKCREANKMLESPGNDMKAKDSFTKALDLVPEHLDSLIGYGKLLIKAGKLSKAEGFLRSALRVDATSVEAQQCLAELQERRRGTVLGGQAADPASYSLVGGTNFSKPQDSSHLLLLNKNTVNKNQKNLTARKSSAYMDALMERNLHADLSLQEAGKDVVEYNEKGGDSSSHDSIHNRSDRDDRRDKKKSKRKDHHRRHRRDKRKRSRSSKSRRRRSKEEKRKKKSSNRRHTRDDTSSHLYSSESSLYSSSSYLSSSESYSSVPSEISTRSLTETDLHEKKLKEEDKHSKSHSTYHSQAPKDKRRGDLDDAYNDYDERADDLSRYRKKRSHHRYDDDKKRRHKRKKDSKRHKRRKHHRRRGAED